jgi:CBS domain-containing protein
MTSVSRIMTKDVIVVNPTTPVSIAIKLLAISSVTGLPVVDKDYQLKGILSEVDVMGLLLDASEVDRKTVADFMTTDVQTFTTSATVEEVCSFLLNKHFRRVPIVDKGKLVGVVSRSDIITFLWNEYLSKKK